MIVVLVGAGSLLRHTSRWVVGAWAFLVWLYVLVASSRDVELRYDWGGVWYNDVHRILALIPVLAVPLATAGAVAILRWLLSHARRAVTRAIRSPRASGRLRLAGDRASTALRSPAVRALGGLL
ncbi:hypothetical protein K1Y78_64315, partial [Streptomyces sp. tea 10]|nr:hypothetical protein [Streptomyces sp. tea 10]